MKTINIPLNVPNALSLYRLYSFPFVLILIFLGHKDLFAFFIWFNLTTDILDGWIARRFNQITEIGSKIDALADSGTYILALTGVFVFKWTSFQPHIISLFAFIGLFILSRLYSLLKFGKFSGFHSYGAKIGGYIQGTFFIILFVLGFYTWFYYIMIISGIIIFSENLMISIVMNEYSSNVKGLYWLLETRKEQDRP
jgi:cardiolipin synthase (CMP-forming)